MTFHLSCQKEIQEFDEIVPVEGNIYEDGNPGICWGFFFLRLNNKNSRSLVEIYGCF